MAKKDVISYANFLVRGDQKHQKLALNSVNMELMLGVKSQLMQVQTIIGS